ncbi:MAG TPA: tetratricopeptide repeat protein [Pilimelia sp.]|nr:tetratricopeptide repeat protein [Pilimelia sp.]
MSSDVPDQATPDQHVRRAHLLADLGRYDEAAAELTAALAAHPQDGAALVLLAQVQLAAERPDAALVAADAAVAATGGAVPALGVRAMALADLRRFREAAELADEIVRREPNDAGALRLGAAILAESRNGQPALDAAWRAVQLAPQDSQAHLVLGIVALRLELRDIAEQAFREALRLDPNLAQARHNIGVLRLEQRRYAEALEHLTDAAAMRPGDPGGGRAVGAGLYRVLVFAAGYALLAPVLVACAAGGGGGASRVLAVLLALGGGLAGGLFLARLRRGQSGPVLGALVRGDRWLAAATWGTAASPPLLLLYAVIGTPVPLVLAVLAGSVALLANFLADRR